MGEFRTMLGNRCTYFVGKPEPEPTRGYFGAYSNNQCWDDNCTRRAKHAIFAAWALGLMVLLVILFVELVVDYQGVAGVNDVGGSGQLIPLIIGCASMILVIYHIACQEYPPRDRPVNPPATGYANGGNAPPTGGDYVSPPVEDNPPPAAAGGEGSYAAGGASQTLPQPARVIDINTGEIVTPPSTQQGYAILSHTWYEKEIILSDIQAVGSVFNLGASRAGDKIRGAVQAARNQGMRYLWMDTCCIDKTNREEESIAIRSMADWYANAQVCLVYLDDTEHCTFEEIVALKKSMSRELYREIVQLQDEIEGLNSRLDSVLQSNRGGDRELESMGGIGADTTNLDSEGLENYQRLTDLKYQNERTIVKLTSAIEEKEKALLREREKAREKDQRERRSVIPRWCTRGWTLQEIVMCCKAIFYNKRWEQIGTYGGGNFGNKNVISDLCSVPPLAICQGKANTGTLGASSVLALMSARNTTKEQDLIYSCMGMLGIDLQVDYDEKFEDTLTRAIDEIIRNTQDISVFNWTGRQLCSGVPGRSLYPINVRGYENEYANLGPLISESKITLANPGIIASFEFQRVCILINRTVTPSLEAVEKFSDTSIIDPDSDLFTCQIINERGIQAKTWFICSTVTLKNELRFLDSLPFEVNKEPFSGMHNGVPGMAPEAQRFLREKNVENFVGQWVLAKFAGVRGAKWFLCLLEKERGGDGFTGRRIPTDEFKFELGQTEDMLDTHRFKVPGCKVHMM
ncbi:heterokaryon incompatibility protein-domain-containing protein [Trichophaea hybrida]|nr:heterokaryon incompatibility protein-domain-containing protein [Trichophaea hybrida]